MTHNKIVRLMSLFGSLKMALPLSSVTLLKNTDLKINEIYKLERAKFMHHASTNSLPKCLSYMFAHISTLHSYPTSSSRRRIFYPPHAKSNAYKKSIFNAGINLWDKIGSSLKEMSFCHFSKEFK